MKTLRWLLIFLFVSPLLAQNVRWDLPVTTVQAQGGNLLPVFAIPGAGVKFYSCSGLTCTTLATTYISATSSTACPNSPTPAQIVLNGTSTCVSTADPYGNMGGWFQPGQYMAMISVGSISYPYYFSVALANGAGATFTQINKDFLCGGYTPSGSNTALDNCWAAVVTYYNANASPTNQVVATVYVPSGLNQTCFGLVAPTPTGTNLPLTLRLKGAGKGEFGVGTKIQASCSMSTPVVDEPWLSVSTPYSGYWSDTVAEGFTVDANNLAPKCWAFYGQRFGHFAHMSCENATDTYAWGVISDVATQYGGQVPSGYQGQGLNVTVDDVFIYANYTAAYATITATPSAGALTFGVTGGGSYRSPLPLYVFLSGNQNGTASQPCATMPTGLQANTTYNAGTGFYQVTSITATTYGSGCSGTVYAVVPGMPANGAQYGLVLANTDSTYKDEQNDGVGIQAGLYHNPGGANTIIHPHPWGMPYGIKDFGQNTVINPEFDTNFGAGMIFAYGLGTKVFSPKFVWPPTFTQQAGAGGYYFPVNAGGGITTGQITITGEDCGTGQTFGGYNRFSQYGFGPRSAAQLQATGFLKNLPDGQDCGSIFVPASVTATISGGSLATCTVNNPSQNGPYDAIPKLLIPGNGALTAVLTGTTLTSCTVATPGSGYASAPPVVVVDSLFTDTPPTDSAIAGTVINGEMTFKIRNSNGTAQTQFLLATLEPYNSNTAAAPSVTVELTQGSLSSPRSFQHIILSNIVGTDCGAGAGASKVDYQWNAIGSVANLSAAYITAYRQADCSTNIYYVPGAYGVASVKVLNAQDPNVKILPNPIQQTDAGTLVFDSSNPTTYPYSTIPGTITPAYFTTNNLSAPLYAAGGGTAQAQTVTLSPAATSLQPGLVVRWKPAAANTAAAPTLQVNTLTAPNIVKCGTTALVANDLTTSAVAVAVYDGTYWQLLNPQAVGCGIPASAALTVFTGASAWTVPTASGQFSGWWFTPSIAKTLVSADIGYSTQGNCSVVQGLILWDQTAGSSAGAIGNLVNSSNAQQITGLSVALTANHQYRVTTSATATCTTQPVVNVLLQLQ